MPKPSSAPELVTLTAETINPGAYDAQGCLARADGLLVFGEERSKLAGYGQEYHGAERHEGRGQDKHELVELVDAPVLLGAEIVSHQRTHALHDAVDSEIEEGLQFVVRAEHLDVQLREEESMPLSAEMSRLGRARFSTAGMPTE